MDQTQTLEPIDIAVGARIRRRREALGVSAIALAKNLGLTDEQLSRYEEGISPIPAALLWVISGFLDTVPSHFFAGIGARPHSD